MGCGSIDCDNPNVRQTVAGCCKPVCTAIHFFTGPPRPALTEAYTRSLICAADPIQQDSQVILQSHFPAGQPPACTVAWAIPVWDLDFPLTFLLGHFSSLLRFLWMAAQLPGVSAVSPIYKVTACSIIQVINEVILHPVLTFGIHHH